MPLSKTFKSLEVFLIAKTTDHKVCFMQVDLCLSLYSNTTIKVYLLIRGKKNKQSNKVLPKRECMSQTNKAFVLSMLTRNRKKEKK